MLATGYSGFGTGGYDEDRYGDVTRLESNYVPNKYNFNANIPVNTESNKPNEKTDLSTIIGTMKIEMAKPNTELTTEHDAYAKMAMTSQKAFLNGQTEAQRYLDHQGIRKTIVASNRYGVMLRDNDTGKHTLALRGMRPGNIRDMSNVASQTAGRGEGRRMANMLIDQVESNGGVVERVVGFSMGGADAFDVAIERGINATLFDPAINPRHVFRNSLSIGRNTPDIEIVRNPENFISVGTAFRNVSLNPQFRVSVVPTGQSGIFANHELLPNFTLTQHSDADAVAERLASVANKFATHTTMIDMKKSINQGESFTQFYRALNSRDGQPSHIDIDVDGVYNKLGTRVNNGSPLVKMWEALDGKFNDFESEHLARAPVSVRPDTLAMDSDTVELIRKNDLDTALRRSQSAFEEAMNGMNNNEVFSHPATENAFKQHLNDAVQPVSLITGAGAAVLGSGAMKIIDPTGSFGQNTEEGVLENQATSGAITGVISHVMNRGLAGQTTLVSSGVGSIALSSAIGAVAAEGTRYGVEKGLEKANANSDTKKSVSNLAGGAVGGATTVAVADAMAIGFATATGAEIGATAGPVGVLAGAGVGAVFGTLAYAVAKVNQIPQVSKAEKKMQRGATKTIHWLKGLF